MADYAQKQAPGSTPFGDVRFGLRNDTAGDLTGGTNATLACEQLDSAGSLRHTAEGGKATYVCNSQFACDSTATDIWTFPGQATLNVKILWFRFSSVATTAITGRVSLLLRSTANTAGTKAASPILKYDQRSAAASSAPQQYTVHPSALGTQIGTSNLVSEQYLQNVAGSTVLPNTVMWDFRTGYGGQALRLAGTAQILCFNVAAALGAGGNLWDITCCFVEEALTA